MAAIGTKPTWPGWSVRSGLEANPEVVGRKANPKHSRQPKPCRDALSDAPVLLPNSIQLPVGSTGISRCRSHIQCAR